MRGQSFGGTVKQRVGFVSILRGGANVAVAVEQFGSKVIRLHHLVT